MTLSMIEIYNEKIKDLLVSPSRGNASERDLGLKGKPKYLKMRSDGGRVHILNLSQLNCECMEDVFAALDTGYKNRAVGITDMNAHSSRSHCLLTINVQGVHHSTATKYTSKLNLIDLAGSERVKQSNASGDRMKEAQSINKSLSALGNVECIYPEFRSFDICYFAMFSVFMDHVDRSFRFWKRSRPKSNIFHIVIRNLRFCSKIRLETMRKRSCLSTCRRAQRM